MKSHVALGLAALLGAALTGGMSSAYASSQQSASDARPTSATVDPQLMRDSQRVRSIFGFTADEAHISRLVGSRAADEAALADGVVLTGAEASEMLVRQARVRQYGRLVDQAAATPGFAGYLVERGGDSFRLQFKVGTSNSAIDAVLQDAPDRSRVALDLVQHSQQDLLALKEKLIDALMADGKGVLDGVALDTAQNGLMVTSRHAEQDVLSAVRPIMGSVPIEVRHSAGDEDTSCTSRASCNDPQRAGVKIDNSLSRCSSGFVVKQNGDEKVLTAGHCWYGYSGERIYGGTAGFFGYTTNEQALYNNTTADARLISTADSTSNNWIFTRSSPHAVVGQKHNSYGQTGVGTYLCYYAYELPSSNCGTVQHTEYSYNSPTCGCRVNRAILTSQTSLGGNSGGAVSSESGYTAVGIISGNSSGLGRFSHITEAEARLFVTLSTSLD